MYFTITIIWTAQFKYFFHYFTIELMRFTLNKRNYLLKNSIPRFIFLINDLSDEEIMTVMQQ